MTQLCLRKGYFLLPKLFRLYSLWFLIFTIAASPYPHKTFISFGTVKLKIPFHNLLFANLNIKRFWVFVVLGLCFSKFGAKTHLVTLSKLM